MLDRLASVQRIISTFCPEDGRALFNMPAWWREASFSYYFYAYTQLGGSLLHALWRRT